MVDYDPAGAASAQVLPFVDLPTVTTPVTAAWLNHVNAVLADIAGAGARIPDLESDTTWSYLAADTSAVNNSTTLVDSGLTFPVVGSARYVVTGALYYSSNATADIRLATVPTTATLTGKQSFHGLGAAIASSPGSSEQAWLNTFGTGALFHLGGDTTFPQMTAHYTACFVPNVSGSVKIQFAQSVANVSDTKIMAASWLRIEVVT